MQVTSIRVTSIILVLAFVISSITFILPSNVSAATDTWNQTSGNLASTDANWLDGTKPVAGADVIFDATSTAVCTWDLAITLTTFSMNAGYSGTVTIGASFGTTGAFTVAQGTLTGSASYLVTVAGNFVHSGGTITNNLLRLALTGSGTTVRVSNTLLDLTVSNNVEVSTSLLGVRRTLTIDSGKTLTVPAGTGLNWQSIGGGTFSNSGTITGTSTLYIYSYNVNSIVTFGTVTISTVTVNLQSGGSSSTVTLGAAATLGGSSTLTVSSSQAGQTMTLDTSTSNYALTPGRILLGSGGVLNGRGSTITCTGSGSTSAWDSSAGTFTAGTSKVILQGSSKTVKTKSAESFYDLRISGDTSVLSSVNVTHNLTVDAGKTFTVASGYTLTYGCSSTGVYANSGALSGSGSMVYALDTANMTLAFGTINIAVLIKLTSTATGNRTLTSIGDTRFGRSLNVSSEHASYWITFDARDGDVTVVMGFTNGTRAIVYYSTWTASVPYIYGISQNATGYYARNMVTGMIEFYADTYADTVVSYAVNESAIGGSINFEPGTFVFQAPYDFYVGGWNRSVSIANTYNLTISGSAGNVLKFRDNLAVAGGKGVAIFVVYGTSEDITFQGLNFEWSSGLSATYMSGVFYSAAIVNMVIEGCTFTGLNYSLWGDGTEHGTGTSGNAYLNNTFSDSVHGMALHNIPSGALISGNVFDNVDGALFIDSVSNILVTDNTFIDCGNSWYCVYVYDGVSNLTISNNSFDGKSQASAIGITIASSSGKDDSSNIVIQNNGFSDFLAGIDIQASNESSVRYNGFKNVTTQISGAGTNMSIYGNTNYTCGATDPAYVNFDADYITFDNGIHFRATILTGWLNVSFSDVTTNDVLNWTTTTDESSTIIFTILALPYYGGSNTGYLFKSGQLIYVSETEGYLIYSTSEAGNYTLKIWYSAQIRSLVQLTFSAFTIGVFVAVVSAAILPLKNERNRRPEHLTKHMINIAIYAVIGATAIGIMYSLMYG